MKLLLTTAVLIAYHALLSKGIEKHERKIEKPNKLTSFFQENNSSLSIAKNTNKTRDKENNKPLSHMINSTGKNEKDQESAKQERKIEKPNKLTSFFQENNSSLSIAKNTSKTSDKENSKPLSHMINSTGENEKDQESAKNERKFEKPNKLASFFQENNSSLSTAKNSNKTKDKVNNKPVPLMINSTGGNEKDQESAKIVSKIKNLEVGKEKQKDYSEFMSKVKKENQTLNETGKTNRTSAEVHKTHNTKTDQDEKKQKAVIRQMLCELFNISKESEACKEKRHSKKAMIWPTRMIPWLKKVLINKLNHGYNNHMSFLDNMEGLTEAPFGGLSDNWDGNPFPNVHRKHHHGLKMVPLLKTLKTRLYGQRTPGDFGSLNDALNGGGLNGEGLNGFGPMPTQSSSHLIRQILGQALGGSDRKSVLNEMMQEFLLANNREESNEGFGDLTGRNGFSQFSNGLQSSPILTEPNQGIGTEQLDGINMLQGNMRTSLASEQPIHAQMLDNGAIAPMPSQQVGNSPLKVASLLGGRSPIGRSPLIGSPLRMPSISAASINSPTSRSSQLNSVLVAPQREGSLLQKAGGFDLPMPSSMLQRTANPTQRMYTEGEGLEQGISSQEDNFIERNVAGERRLPLRQPESESPLRQAVSDSPLRQAVSESPLRQAVGNNLVMEEISDSMARGRNLPMQTNPDLNRLMKFRSNFRSAGSPSLSRFSHLGLDSNFDHGLRLPVGSNTMGLASVLSKDEDSINLEDLNNERSFAFRREKVLKGNLLHSTPKKSKTSHDKVEKTSKGGR